MSITPVQFYRTFLLLQGQKVVHVTNVTQTEKLTSVVMRYIRLGGM